MERVSVADVRRGYTREKARKDLVCSIWGYAVLRPLSFLLTPAFVNLGLSANAITALGLLPLAGGLATLVLGGLTPIWSVLGAVLVNMWQLLDHVDGNVARFHGKTSKFGELLDFVVGTLLFFLPLCVGAGLYLASDPGAPVGILNLKLPAAIWMVVGVASFSAQLFRKVISLRARITTKREAWGPGRKVSILTVLPRSIVSLESPLLLVASLTGAMDLFLIVYAAYNLLTFPAMVVYALREALLLDRR